MIFRRSPNYNARPKGAKVTCILLHADGSDGAQDTVTYLCTKHADKNENKSYHYLIGRDGGVWQLVATRDRAWHAGESERLGVPRVNDFSVGVCWSNNQRGEPFTDQAIDAGVDLCADLCREFHLDPRVAIDRHSAVARPAGRKHDPGPLFPFAEFVERVARAIGR